MSADVQTQGIDWQRLQRPALIVGGAGLAVLVLGGIFWPEHFFQSYLVAFLFLLALTLGSFAIWMLHNVTGGFWGLLIQRWCEAATRTLPLLALYFVPVACGVYYLYVWANPGDAALDAEARHLLEKKEPYLNVPFFLARAAFYFAVWLVLMFLLNRWSDEHDRTGDRAVARRMQVLSGPGLALYGLTMTFAAIDWIMSLEPLWYSTIFGALVAAGQLLPGFGLAIFAASWLATRKPLADVSHPQYWIDLGNLLLAMVMIWTYMSFSQLLLIWSGNLPEEITWYLARSTDGWQYVGVLLAVFYFAFPFIVLLQRPFKQHPGRLRVIAGLVVVMSVVHQYWLVAPAFASYQLAFLWMDLAAVAGLGGIWVWVVLWQLQLRPLVPVHDPLLQEALHHA